MLISALQHKSKYKSSSILNFFEEKKILFFGFHVKVLVKTFPLTYQLLMYRTDIDKARGDFFSRRTNKIQFRTFLKKIQIFGFPFCSTREDLSIHVSITNVGLILTKPGGISFLGVRKLRSTDKIQFRTFLKKKIKFLGFHFVVLLKIFPLMYQLLM